MGDEQRDPLATRAAVATGALVLRISIDEWGRRMDRDERPSIQQIYREIRTAVVAAAGLLGEEQPARDLAD